MLLIVVSCDVRMFGLLVFVPMRIVSPTLKLSKKGFTPSVGISQQMPKSAMIIPEAGLIASMTCIGVGSKGTP